MTQFFVPPGQPPAGTQTPLSPIDPAAARILDARAQLRLMREQNVALVSGTPTPTAEHPGLLSLPERVRLVADINSGLQAFLIGQ